jgi:hypothetical protein
LELLLFHKLSRKSKKAIQKTKKYWGHPYNYNPRGNLLTRLSRETGMTIDEVYNQLMKERAHLLTLPYRLM